MNNRKLFNLLLHGQLKYIKKELIIHNLQIEQ